MSEFLSCRPNLEVDDLAPAVAFLREVLGFEVEVDEPAMGLVLLRRGAVGLALTQSAAPASTPPPLPISALAYRKLIGPQLEGRPSARQMANGSTSH